jgi:hypothetical protein
MITTLPVARNEIARVPFWAFCLHGQDPWEAGLAYTSDLGWKSNPIQIHPEVGLRIFSVPGKNCVIITSDDDIDEYLAEREER